MLRVFCHRSASHRIAAATHAKVKYNQRVCVHVRCTRTIRLQAPVFATTTTLSPSHMFGIIVLCFGGDGIAGAVFAHTYGQSYAAHMRMPQSSAAVIRQLHTRICTSYGSSTLCLCRRNTPVSRSDPSAVSALDGGHLRINHHNRAPGRARQSTRLDMCT